MVPNGSPHLATCFHSSSDKQKIHQNQTKLTKHNFFSNYTVTDNVSVKKFNILNISDGRELLFFKSFIFVVSATYMCNNKPRIESRGTVPYCVKIPDPLVLEVLGQLCQLQPLTRIRIQQFSVQRTTALQHGIIRELFFIHYRVITGKIPGSELPHWVLAAPTMFLFVDPC
jgi:hypothetical protein